MVATVETVSHAVAALLFAVLSLWQVRRPKGGMQPGALALACAATSLWALAVVMDGGSALFSRFAESGRNLAWLGFMLALLLRGQDDECRRPIVALYAVLAAIVMGLSAVELLPAAVDADRRLLDALFFAVLGLRMTVAIGALVLVHNLYTAASHDARWGIRLPMLALAAMWAFDLNLYTVAYLTRAAPVELFAVRGMMMTAIAPMFALAMWRDAQWKMRLSRAVTFQSLSLMAIGGYLVVMVVVAKMLEVIGSGYLQLAQFTVVVGMSAMALLLLPTGRARAWLKVKVAKHLFQHRYDYRVEWLRFTDTLGRPGGGAAPLDERVVKAIADITESPGGILLMPEESGALAATAAWSWPGLPLSMAYGSPALARHFAATARIVELDALRRGDETYPGEAALIPGWLVDEPRAWVAAPLMHVDKLVGVVVLARPLVDRKLDWEDFDLLRVAGRQVASYLAEARGQEALSEAKRFDEFNRRFAFIMHDIKNLVSQLSLVARNAERHADNPEFRADMVATLQASVGKMNDLLARLSQHNRARVEEPRPVALRALAQGLSRHRGVRIEGRADVIARADPSRLEQALGHLVQNAIDASGPGGEVTILIGQRGLDASIEVIDRGPGMSAEFVRTRLFTPFASTKEGGFGIGAFEARSLVAAMGGRVEVESREGEGSRFTIVLPLAMEPAMLRKSA